MNSLMTSFDPKPYLDFIESSIVTLNKKFDTSGLCLQIAQKLQINGESKALSACEVVTKNTASLPLAVLGGIHLTAGLLYLSNRNHSLFKAACLTVVGGSLVAISGLTEEQKAVTATAAAILTLMCKRYSSYHGKQTQPAVSDPMKKMV